jgi:hypothetical protein
MSNADDFSSDDLPDSPHARQLRAGFPWLTFTQDLEMQFRRRKFDENLNHTRVYLCLAILITIAFSAMDSMVLGPGLNRIPGMIRMLIIEYRCGLRTAGPRSYARRIDPTRR